MNRVIEKKRAIIFLVLTAVLATILVIPFAANAQGTCDQVVVDDAGVFGSGASAVSAAANQLISSGADVRVRTIPTFGNAGNLDRYESQLEQQCPSWTDASGNRKNNLVVILVALQERQTGLYYGSHWDNALGGHWTQIQTNIMNPRFAQGDFAGGVTAGLQEVNRLIQVPSGGQTQPAQSSGTSASWVALGIVLAIIFIFALLGGILLFMNSRRSRERRLAASQKALLAKQGAASKVNQLVEEIQMLEIKVNATAAKVSPEDAAPLVEGFNKAKNLVDQGAQKYSELGHSAGDPENPKLGESQLGVVADEYQKVLDILNQAGEEVNREEAALDTFQQAIDGFSNKAAGVDAAILAALRKIEAAQNSSFKTEYPAGTLDKARHSLVQARSLYQSKKFLQATKTLDDAAGLASQAGQYADELPQKKRDTETAIQTLSSRIEQIKKSIEGGRVIFDKISATYAESSWESIHGNGTEAENRVNWTLEGLDKARAAASAEQQDWAKAAELVKQGNTWLDEAESFMHSISAMETSLESARRDAPGEIADTQADIAGAWKYIYAYDEDIRESLEDDLHEAEKKLNSASEELHRDKPDYLMLVKTVREAHESADKILAQARTEHEAAERLRSKAASTLRDARSRTSIARAYIQDHNQDAGDEARRHLSNAEAALSQAEASSDLNNQIALAGTAETAADSAYASARARVDEAWQRRQPVMPPVIILPGGGYRGGGSWGSRRGSPWTSGGGWGGGGRGGGGGGSTGWGAGGGGRGGGGSTHW